MRACTEHSPLALEAAKASVNGARVDNDSWNLVDVEQLKAQGAVAAGYVQDATPAAEYVDTKCLEQKVTEDPGALLLVQHAPSLGAWYLPPRLVQSAQFACRSNYCFLRCARFSEALNASYAILDGRVGGAPCVALIHPLLLL